MSHALLTRSQNAEREPRCDPIEAEVHVRSPDADESPEEDGPAKKKPRVRVTKACDICRKRKERCDGAQPRCQRCNKLNLACSYHQGRKRGLRSGYVRGLEILLGLFLNTYPGSERLVLSALESDAERLAPIDHLDERSTSQPHTLSLLESWRSSKACEGLQKLLRALEEGEDEESRLRDLDLKVTSIFNDTQIHLDQQTSRQAVSIEASQLHSFDGLAQPLPEGSTTEFQGLQPSREPIPPLDPAVIQTIQTTSSSCGSQTSPTAPGDPLPADWPRLLDKYIASTHCWLPIIEKYTLFRSASLLASTLNTTTRGSISVGEVASLWAVLAYGEHLTCQSTAGRSVSHASSKIQLNALRLATQHTDTYQMGHAQALLILSLLDVAKGRWNSAWLLVARAVHITVILGITPRADRQACQPLNNCEKRLFQGCFILDILLSSRLGFRSYLNHTDLQSVGDIGTEDLEEWEIWNPNTTVNSSTQSYAGPNRVFSYFNTFGLLTGLLKQSIKTDSSMFIAPMSLLQSFLKIEDKIIDLDTQACSGGSDQEAHLHGPPHVIHLRIFAASLYGILYHQVRHSPDGYRTEAPKPRSSNILDILRILELDRHRLHELLILPNTPPTVQIFIDIFEQSRLRSTSGQPAISRWGQPQRGSSMNISGLEQDQASSSLLCAHIDAQQRSLGPTTTGHVNAYAVEAETPSRLQPQGSSTQAPYSASSNILQVAESASSLHPADFGNADLIGANSGATAHVGEPPAPPAGTAFDRGRPLEDTSLFGQLSLLDTYDWSNITEDLMERLGYSRDGDVIDFQSLISIE